MSRVKYDPDLIQSYLLAAVEAHPRNLVSVAMREFELTRPAVLAHLDKLIEEGQIRKSGKKNRVSYGLPEFEYAWEEPIGKDGDESVLWTRHFESLIGRQSKNIQDIFNYSVTEMINNAIEHSTGTQMVLMYNETPATIEIRIRDNGVGIFRKISDALQLEDPKEALLHLSKGKLTTDSANHTGQGIFFTSRAVDRFSIWSGSLFYMRFNHQSDWLAEERTTDFRGTMVTLELAKNSPRNLVDVFREYENDEYGFSKTTIAVEMAKLEDEEYISRSQARRLVLGLDKFETVVLDFKKVRIVGQGFVDEVFRVFKNAHPEMTIGYINANSDVEFMIKRGIASAG